MKLQGSCDSTLGVAIAPLERLGLGVVVADVAHDLAFKVSLGGEDPSDDQVALDLGEPGFDLVEPRGISRNVVEVHVGMVREDLCNRCLIRTAHPQPRISGSTHPIFPGSHHDRHDRQRRTSINPSAQGRIQGLRLLHTELRSALDRRSLARSALQMQENGRLAGMRGEHALDFL